MNNQIDISLIVKYFLYKSNFDQNRNFTITPLKLQKLLYYAQAWNLAIYKRKLFENEIQAWIHGPVVKDIYYKYRKYGYNQIREHINSPPKELLSKNNKLVKDLLDTVWRVYGQYDGKQLEKLTHSEPPWQNARKGKKKKERSNKVIKTTDMMEYYDGDFSKI